MADVVVGGMTSQFTRRGACGNYFMWNFDFPCVLDEVFFEFTIFFGVVLLETGSLSLVKNDSRMNPDIKPLWSTANQCELLTLYSNFSVL